jgi:hypothetical protein
MASVGTVVEEIVGELRAAVERELQGLRRAVPGGGLAEIEERLQALRSAWDKMVLGAVGRVLGNGYCGGSMPCRCGGRMRYVSDRSKSILTTLGRLELVRAYYRCPQCGASRFPLDEQLGTVGEGQSMGVQAMTALVCSLLPNGQALALLKELRIPCVSLSESQRITRAVGARAVAWRAAEVRRWAQDHVPPADHVQRTVPPCLAVSMDGTTVHVDGDFHEVKIGAFFRFNGKGEAVGQKGYVATFAGIEAFRDLWDTEAQRGCMAEVATLVALCDGGVWTWNTVAERCPAHVVEVLDFYHASEHLWTLARSLWGEGSARAGAWVAEQKQRLLEGREDDFFRELECWAQKGHDWSDEGEKQLRYFTTNRHRIHYKQYRDCGYPIGSGVVEAACKTVVCTREKQPGMRWRKTTAEAIAHLRAVYQSGRWHSLRQRLIAHSRQAA